MIKQLITLITKKTPNRTISGFSFGHIGVSTRLQGGIRGRMSSAVQSHYQAAVVNQAPAAVKQTTSFLLQSCLFACSAFQENLHSASFHASHTNTLMQEYTLHACNRSHKHIRCTDGEETDTRTWSHSNRGNKRETRSDLLPRSSEWTPRETQHGSGFWSIPKEMRKCYQ